MGILARLMFFLQAKHIDRLISNDKQIFYAFTRTHINKERENVYFWIVTENIIVETCANKHYGEGRGQLDEKEEGKMWSENFWTVSNDKRATTTIN